jgi:putative addiction module killer protein
LPIAQKYSIRKLVLDSGVCLFDQWFESLKDDDQVMVDDRLARVRQGSLGEINSVGGGVWELKFRKGKAIRLYYGIVGRQVVLLIVGGDKRTQKRDIEKARALFLLFKEGIGHDENH